MSVPEPFPLAEHTPTSEANNGRETYMEIAPRDITIRALLPFLIQKHTTAEACKNAVKLFLTLQKTVSDISIDEAEYAANVVAELHKESLHYKKSLIEPMLFFGGLGIPAIPEWILDNDVARDEFSEIMCDFKNGENVNSDLALALFKTWPEFVPQIAGNAKVLLRVVSSNNLDLISYLVNHPQIRVLFIPYGDMRSPVLLPVADMFTELIPLSGAFPLTDPRKASILTKAFGATTLLCSRPTVASKLITAKAMIAIMKESLNDSNDFFTALHQLFMYMDEFSHDTLDIRNERGETILMKLIEYRDRYAELAKTNWMMMKCPDLDKNYWLMLKYFAENADVNVADERGETALIKAIKKGD